MKRKIRSTQYSDLKWWPKQFLLHCTIMLIHANNLKTAPPISIFFSSKDAYLNKAITKKRVKKFTYFNRRLHPKAKSWVQLDPPIHLSVKGVNVHSNELYS